MTVPQAHRLGSWLERLGCLVLGAAFIYAAILKIASPQEFADSIAAYQILPYPVINPLALGLPLFELICGLWVLLSHRPRTALLGLWVILIVFMTAFVFASLRGLTIECGCFTAHSWWDSNPWIVLTRDGILLLITACLYIRNIRWQASINWEQNG